MLVFISDTAVKIICQTFLICFICTFIFLIQGGYISYYYLFSLLHADEIKKAD